MDDGQGESLPLSIINRAPPLHPSTPSVLLFPKLDKPNQTSTDFVSYSVSFERQIVAIGDDDQT
jgi:hypothetical protein